MTSHSDDHVNFSDLLGSLNCQQVWESPYLSQESCRDIPSAIYDAVQNPENFPPIQAAIVPGDSVALAVDANLPSVASLVTGAIKAIGQSSAEQLRVIVSDEATDATIREIKQEIGPDIPVLRHTPSDRESLRYLGADEFADPIYLNRHLVDADFVLPIAPRRREDAAGNHDLTGIFPSFADSRSRLRHLDQSNREPSTASGESFDCKQPAVLLGTQVMICVDVNQGGAVGKVIAGTPHSLEIRPINPKPAPFSAPLVIASLDGNQQQQTWENVARALNNASQHVEPGGTIVIWSAIDEPPSNAMIKTNTHGDEETSLEEASVANPPEEDPSEEDGGDQEFPHWNNQTTAARVLNRVSAEHRILLRANISPSLIETMGLGVVSNEAELARLSSGFEGCGVLRAAQFSS